RIPGGLFEGIVQGDCGGGGAGAGTAVDGDDAAGGGGCATGGRDAQHHGREQERANICRAEPPASRWHAIWIPSSTRSGPGQVIRCTLWIWESSWRTRRAPRMRAPYPSRLHAALVSA